MTLPDKPAQSIARRLADGFVVHTLQQDQTSHVIVAAGQSVVIDWHTPTLLRWIDRRNLPRPSLVLHTHVQPEHCRQGGVITHDKHGHKHEHAIRTLVPTGSRDLAEHNDAYLRDAAPLWDDPAAWPVTMGEERYGVAGSVTMMPPTPGIRVDGEVAPGEVIEHAGLAFHVIDLKGHGKHSVGYLIKQADVPLAVFTGDFFRDGACLVNVYDLETTYGGTCLDDMPNRLRQLADNLDAWQLTTCFPATGQPIDNAPAQAREIATKIDAYFAAAKWSPADYKAPPKPPADVVEATRGRYVRRAPGVYQITTGGNCILFIDDRGRGMMVDPGPCEFESKTRVADFIADLEAFEQTAGLKSIDLILITHVHGDHYDLAPQVIDRYPSCRVAAWDLVARVIEAPWDYPYPALLPWYDLGFDHLPIDDILSDQSPYHWHDIAIETEHLPGHCYCHAAHILTFAGQRIALTGDTIQSNGGAGGIGYIIANHSVPDDKAGFLRAYRNMAKHPVDLNIGGHGSCFTQPNAQYNASIQRIEHATPYLQALIPGGDLKRAFLRPWFPRLDV